MMDFPVPELGEGLYEAELVEWQVKVGDLVKHGQSLAEVLTDKATMELPSPFAGKITALCVDPGEQVAVGQVILSYDPAEQSEQVQEPLETVSAAASVAASAAPIAKPASSTGNGPLRSVQAAPSVRRMARSLGIDLGDVSGSGRGGRILIDDLSAHVRVRSPGTSDDGGQIEDNSVDVGIAGSRIPMIGLRRKIAERMSLAKQTAPHYGYVDECDVTQLVNLRQGLKGEFAERGVKLTYVSFIVKAVVAALKEVPLVNATLDQEAGEIVLHDEYHIGIASTTSRGLLVPVLKNADRRNLLDIAREIDRLSRAAREGQANVEELRGSTFTVTSIGNLGGLISTPVLNHPEVGIMGVGQIKKRPVFDDRGQVMPAELVYLSFSFDHRVVDGAVGALFGNAVKRQLENPAPLLL